MLLFVAVGEGRRNAMGFPLSVGLQGPRITNGAFRCDITQRTNATRSVDEHNYLIRWSAHGLGMRRIQELLSLHTSTDAHPRQQRQLFVLVGQRHPTTAIAPSSFELVFSVPSHGLAKEASEVGRASNLRPNR